MSRLAFEFDDMIVYTSGYCIVNFVTVFVFLSSPGGLESTKDEAASTNLNFDRSAEVGYVVNSIIIISECRNRSDHEIGIP